jgi:hypothetical protein
MTIYSTHEFALRLKEVIGDKTVPIPAFDVVKELVTTTFFASLEKEEGRELAFSVAYLDRQELQKQHGSEWLWCSFEFKEPTSRPPYVGRDAERPRSAPGRGLALQRRPRRDPPRGGIVIHGAARTAPASGGIVIHRAYADRSGHVMCSRLCDQSKEGRSIESARRLWPRCHVATRPNRAARRYRGRATGRPQGAVYAAQAPS